MKESDKNIENLIEKVMVENTLESPSIDFTSKVMSQVLIANESKIKTYKPLISKQIWFLIIGTLLALTVYVFMFGSSYDLKITYLYTSKISNFFSVIPVSNSVFYAVLVVSFMVLIQVGVLKNYFDKKYQL